MAPHSLALTALGAAILAAVAAAVLPTISGAAPDWTSLQTAVQTAQFETLAADAVPWYSCH